jgi:hypothetical protein
MVKTHTENRPQNLLCKKEQRKAIMQKQGNENPLCKNRATKSHYTEKGATKNGSTTEIY